MENSGRFCGPSNLGQPRVRELTPQNGKVRRVGLPCATRVRCFAHSVQHAPLHVWGGTLRWQRCSGTDVAVRLRVKISELRERAAQGAFKERAGDSCRGESGFPRETAGISATASRGRRIARLGRSSPRSCQPIQCRRADAERIRRLYSGQKASGGTRPLSSSDVLTSLPMSQATYRAGSKLPKGILSNLSTVSRVPSGKAGSFIRRFIRQRS